MPTTWSSGPNSVRIWPGKVKRYYPTARGWRGSWPPFRKASGPCSGNVPSGWPSAQKPVDAGREIVPSKEARALWENELLERLRTAKKALTMSVDFSSFSEASMKNIASWLVAIEKAVAELSVHAGKRIKQLKKEHDDEV
jgi:hypothetical protein